MTVVERFLKYIVIETTSDETSQTVPSTKSQLEFGRILVDELKMLGVEDARIDEKGYIYGSIPATPGRENDPVIGFIAHMDTAPSMEGKNIKPSIVKNYQGGDIVLDKDAKIIMKVAEFSHLLKYIGQDIIVTDGTTLLSADDKAGIAEIMTFVQEILEDKSLSHGKIAIGFTPDEEIGRGADHFNVEEFGAAYAYTVDGGQLGELEYENFNAAGAKVIVRGVNIHPGEAKNRMKNAILIGMEFHQMLPVHENPAYTEGYEGFQHLGQIEGNEEQAILDYIIRDHDMELFQEKKLRFEKIAAYLNEKYGENTIELMIKDNYYNMKKQIEPHMYIVESAKKAMEAVGIEPLIVPIRGGTDGSRLSYMGLPCPNLSTGGHNFHGRYEYIPCQSMEKMVQVLKEIVVAK